MRELIGFVFNPLTQNSATFVQELIKELNLGDKSWTTPTSELDNRAKELSETKTMVLMGGDGTILRAVRVLSKYDIPMVTINMGRIGFMSELTVEEAKDKLSKYLSGKVRIEERRMLKASIYRYNDEHPAVVMHALNDVVLGRGGVAKLLDINAVANGEQLTRYRADAVIVSTATGSTGYAMSAGGPIIFPDCRLMLLQPVAPHTGLQRGLVLPEDATIELSVKDAENVMLSVDGFVEKDFKANDKVVITVSPNVVKFLREKPSATFYSSLTRRLGLEKSSIPNQRSD